MSTTGGFHRRVTVGRDFVSSSPLESDKSSLLMSSLSSSLCKLLTKFLADDERPVSPLLLELLLFEYFDKLLLLVRGLVRWSDRIIVPFALISAESTDLLAGTSRIFGALLPRDFLLPVF